jgi:CubicO group peptidase (beta-lactamase class C family)
MTTLRTDPQSYYPLSESRGGWRRADEREAARSLAGMDLDRLAAAQTWNEQFGVASAIAVIRHGYLVAEWYANGATPETKFNTHSCSKSFTGTAYGILFGEARAGQQGEPPVDLASPAYPFIPAGYPLSDPRKERITLRHLLSMSSGIPGENLGVFGVRTAPEVNAFEGALGRLPVLTRQGEERSVATLAGEPGSIWDYSDPGFSHLSLAFQNITGCELDVFMQNHVFTPIGLESVSWDSMGLDDGWIGRHTMPFSGVNITAREFARFGYLMLRHGVWAGRELVPGWWVEQAARTSQPMYHPYGLTWWVNAQPSLWPEVPPEAFAAMGYNCNLCCIIPSLDVVAVRIGNGPTDSTELIAAPFLGAVAGAVIGA